MSRNTFLFCLAVALAGLSGCSSHDADDAKKAATPKDRIQGKAQVVLAETSAADNALNAGGPSVYIWQGAHRYRLYLKTAPPFEIEGGKQYIVEGINAQKVIDELGDPAEGTKGYPLESSCARVVKMAWPGQAFDVTDGQVTALRNRVKRYPARPVFLVTGIQEAPEDEGAAKSADAKKKKAEPEIPEIEVPAEKQKALLIAGSPVRPAPLWEPKGGTINCKVLIGTDGNIMDLETGAQLCEAVHWEEFRYQPTIQRGRPVEVRTEVEIRFEPRKPPVT